MVKPLGTEISAEPSFWLCPDDVSLVTVTLRFAAPTVTDVGATVTVKFRVFWAGLGPFASRLDGVTPLGLVAELEPPLHAAAATVNPRPTADVRRVRHGLCTLLFIEKTPGVIENSRRVVHAAFRPNVIARFVTEEPGRF